MQSPLLTCYDPQNAFEIGVDEAGRGPLFGRLYVGAVVLPKEGGFHHEWMKDSKRFHSKKKIRDIAEYIKANAVAWSVQYIEADVIDEINIRQSVFRGMHNAIREIITTKTGLDGVFLLVDGNDFRPYTVFEEDTDTLRVVHTKPLRVATTNTRPSQRHPFWLKWLAMIIFPYCVQNIQN